MENRYFFFKKKKGSIFFQKNGGWHFSYIKDAKGIENKLKSTRHHVDYDLHPIGVKGIKEMIKQKKLIYNYGVDQRKNKFLDTETLKEMSVNNLPEYIRINQNKFKDWIYIEKGNF